MMNVIVSDETGLGHIEAIRGLTLNPYSAGIDFSRQNLTSTDVRF